MPLGPESIAFTGFNSDGNDNVAFVALESIPSGTTTFFTDNEWVNTTPDPSFNAGESAWSWTATSDVAAGTVVRIDNIGSGTLAANIGNATFSDSSNRGLAASDEIVYAYLGASATQPTTFLAAIANGSLTNPAGTPAVILPVGLADGTNALQFGNNIDIAEFNGARNDQTSFSGYAAVLNNPAHWIMQDGGGDQSADATAPDVPFSAAAFSAALGILNRANRSGSTAVLRWKVYTQLAPRSFDVPS